MIIDGVTYEVDWGAFKLGTSFFIPCINAVAARRVVTEHAQAQFYAVLIRDVVEDGIRGLRVWRV